MTNMPIHDTSLFVKVTGQGYPMVIMHGGPGTDHTSLLDLEGLADQFTLIFYDHRCNGRSTGAGVTSMTWENLTADTEALRQALGFEKWAVAGHSFGGMVALEYALRYPDKVSHLVLMDSCGDIRWVQENVTELLAKRGFSAEEVEAARRFFHGQYPPKEFIPIMMKFGKAYYYRATFLTLIEAIFASGYRAKLQPAAAIHAFSQLLPGWTVMDRLGEIKAPTLVLAGRDDFEFPPEHQAILADRLPNAHLELIEKAGHNAPMERPAEVMEAIRRFMAGAVTAASAGAIVGKEEPAAETAAIELSGATGH